MITFAELEAEVRRLAAERPDYVYPAERRPDGGSSCYYQVEGKDRCLFGEALGNLGVNVAPAHEGEGIDFVLGKLEVSSDPDQESWASAVQSYQDAGTRWAEAVRYADEGDE